MTLVAQFRPRNTDRARALRHSATPAERQLWRHLNRSQLGAKFSRQMPVGPYFADFICRERKLVVELDGHSHDMRTEEDTDRDAYLHTAGYRVLRFTNDDALHATEAVVIAIREALNDQ